MRAKVTEGINLAGGAKLAVWDTYGNLGTFPGGGNANYGLPLTVTGTNTSGANGLITITFKSNLGSGANGTTLLLQPSVNHGAIEWTCYAAGKAPQAPLAVNTATLPTQYAPAVCR
ncbi:MAG: pilin [Acidihalobacter sp.]